MPVAPKGLLSRITPLHFALGAIVAAAILFFGYHIVRAAWAPPPLDLVAAASYAPSLGPPVAALHDQATADDMPRPGESSETVRPQERQSEPPAPSPQYLETMEAQMQAQQQKPEEHMQMQMQGQGQGQGQGHAQYAGAVTMEDTAAIAEPAMDAKGAAGSWGGYTMRYEPLDGSASGPLVGGPGDEHPDGPQAFAGANGGADFASYE